MCCPQLDQFISRAGWRTGSASPRRARRQRVGVVRYAQPEPNGKKITAVNWDFFVIAADYAGVRASPRRCCLIFACRERAVPQTPNAGRSLHWTIRQSQWPLSGQPGRLCPAEPWSARSERLRASVRSTSYPTRSSPWSSWLLLQSRRDGRKHRIDAARLCSARSPRGMSCNG
jgi:hypothetical protein